MSFWSYLVDRFAIVVGLVAGVLLSGLALLARGVDARVFVEVACVVCACVLAGLLLDWLRRREFFCRLREALDALDSKYLASELVGRPTTLEGRLMYDALARESKAMTDEVEAERLAQREYRDYVETWIHEVKTPIAAARLVAQNHPDAATAAMDRELVRIEGYAEQALYYARSTSVDRDFAIRSVSLDELVRGALKANARTLIDARIAPELGDLDFEVRCDPKWLTFVLGQVLVNAAKYRKPAGPDGVLEPARLRIGARRRQSEADARVTVLSIADEGVGIPSEDVDRVFDRGFTGQNGRRFAKSTGIGLYLVRSLCEKMGLRVTLASKVGRGTTVSIEFPDSGR